MNFKVLVKVVWLVCDLGKTKSAEVTTSMMKSCIIPLNISQVMTLSRLRSSFRPRK